MTLPRLDGRINMAEDARLLAEAEAGKAGWRVYGWDGAWVSLGHYQSPERDLLDPDGVSWVMRPTGGKAVLHGHDVTVGLAAPLADLANWGDPANPASLARSLKTVYRRAIAPILEAMNACGVPAVLGEELKKPPRLFGEAKRERGLGGEGSRDPPLDLRSECKGGSGVGDPIEDLHPLLPSSSGADGGGRTSDCFAVVSPNDVVDGRTGLKVCGCALKLTQRAVLVQASIPAGAPLIDPRLVFARPAMLATLPWQSEAFPSALEEAMRRRILDPAL